MERHFAGRTVFDIEARQFRNGLQTADQRGDRSGLPATVPLMPSGASSSVPFDAMPAAEGGERRAQVLEAVEPAEAIERRNAEFRLEGG